MNDPIYIEQLRRQQEIDAERIHELRVQLVALQIERDTLHALIASLTNTAVLLEKERDLFRSLLREFVTLYSNSERQLPDDIQVALYTLWLRCAAHLGRKETGDA